MEWLIHLPGSARRGGPAVAISATAIAHKQHRITDLNQTPAGALPAFLQLTSPAARWPTRSAAPAPRPAAPARPPDATGAAPARRTTPDSPGSRAGLIIIGRYRNAASVPPARPPQHPAVPAAEGTQRPTSNPMGAACPAAGPAGRQRPHKAHRTGPRASRAGYIIPHGPADTPTPAAAPGPHSTSTPLRRPRASHAGSPLAPVPWRRGVHPESSPRSTSEGAGTDEGATVTAGRQQLYTPFGCRSHRCPPVASEYRESANRLPHDGHRRVPSMYPASDNTSTARRSPQSEHRGYALLPSNGTPPHESQYRPSGRS